MTALPPAVQQQLDAAEQLQESLEAETNELSQAPIQPPEPPPAEPTVAQAAPQATEPAKDADYWRRRFEIIEGKYRAEVPALHQTVRQQESQLQQLTGRLDQISRTPTPEHKPEPLVTAKDRELVGDDLIDVMRRVVREESRAALQVLAQRMDALESVYQSIAPKAERAAVVEREFEESRKKQFYVDLTRAVPDWEEINPDPRWLKWLIVRDPISGLTRQEMLDDAAAKLDSGRTAAIFQAFKAELAAEPPSQQQQAQTELARQVAPSRSARTTATPSSPKKYTAKQYAYWTDHRRVFDTDKAVLAATLADIEKAVGEDRIVW